MRVGRQNGCSVQGGDYCRGVPDSTRWPNGGASAPSRGSVLGFAVTLAMITYVDRVCISQAAPAIQGDLRLTAVQMGLAFSAFSWAYALFEIPGGWLGDWIGPRKVLMRVVIMWSVFTALTGYVWNAVSLILTRFFFGVGEAGCFPNLTKAFMIWLPRDERTRAQAIMWLSARWAGAFTPLLVIWVMSGLSWRRTFVVFALLGVVWAIVFHLFFRHKSEAGGTPVGAATLESRGPVSEFRVPWERLFSSRTVWLLWAQYFCLTYGWFFYVTWLPTYLKETRGLALDQNGFTLWLGNTLKQFFSLGTTQQVLIAAMAGIPLFFGGFGAIVCGIITPHLARRTGSMARTRKLIALFGFTGAAVLLIGSIHVKDPLLAMCAMGLASFCNDLTMPGSWSGCMDVGGKYAGTLSGSMNMMGSVAAGIAPLVTGILLDSSNRDWRLTFWISGVVYFLGGLCWLWLDPVTPIAEEEV